MDKRYDFKTYDPKYQKLWKDLGLFTYDPTTSKPIFSIDTPPPTVSGALHIGHIFSYTQAEIIARYKRMVGYHVFYPFGFDDNGLPTERLVEGILNKKANEMTREAFTQACLNTTKTYESDFKNLWQALGFSVDWSLQYETISPESQAIAQKSFIDLYDKGLAYAKKSPVQWCPQCQTSIAQAELESLDQTTTFYTLAFKVNDQDLPIATTRPELLGACVAVFINPDDSRYKHLIGQKARVPLYDFEVDILEDTAVDPHKGTGVVMCCTYGDQTDVEWCQTYKLPYKPLLTKEGSIHEDTDLIGGLNIKQARMALCNALIDAGKLLDQTSHMNTCQTHERCGTPVEFMPSKQWYIDLLSYKDKLLQAADAINWYPFYMKNRYTHWVDNLKWDWCISRQRYFGVPFPVWYCQSCHQPKLAALEDLPINPLSQGPTTPCTCGSTDFIPETDVMDTWMTSSLTPQINKKWGTNDQRHELDGPMSLRTQAHEIIRTWAFYTIAKGFYHHDTLPWQDMMICGFVLAKKGQKISKSKSNTHLTPQGLLKDYPADAIRYWTAGTKLGTDTYFSISELDQPKRLMTKLWHAAKFCFMHLSDFNLNETIELLPMDQWIIQRAQMMQTRAHQALAHYEMGTARQIIDDFFWKDFCDDYLELAKERLYQPDKHGYVERKSGQKALFESLLIILKTYGIYMPHITEGIYQAYYADALKSPSLHGLSWDLNKSDASDLLSFGESIKQALQTARRYKSERGLSLKDPMPSLSISLKRDHLAWFEASQLDLLATTGAQEIRLIFE